MKLGPSQTSIFETDFADITLNTILKHSNWANIKFVVSSLISNSKEATIRTSYKSSTNSSRDASKQHIQVLRKRCCAIEGGRAGTATSVFLFLSKFIWRKFSLRMKLSSSNGTKVNRGPTFFSSARIPARLAAHRYRGAIGYVYFFLIFARDGVGVGEGRGDRNRFRGREAPRGSRQYRRIFYQLISTLLPHFHNFLNWKYHFARHRIQWLW